MKVVQQMQRGLAGFVLVAMSVLPAIAPASDADIYHAVRSDGTVVFTDQPRTIALLGVSDLIVVQTADALLVCSRHEAEKIKQLVSQVPAALQ